ncbi:MAG: hypothetical protein KGL20_08460 [Rhodospirillales bacterium]|nr:hypothetical protein [Rhodospirillales bacterium]
MHDSPHNPNPSPESDPAPVNPDVAYLRDAKLDLAAPCEARLAAILNVARYHGVEMNLETLRLRRGEKVPNPPELIAWAQEAGLWARGVHVNFRQLL